MIEDVNKLQTEDVDVVINEEIRNLIGSILFCVGDTPASAKLGGFQESVSAFRPCLHGNIGHVDNYIQIQRFTFMRCSKSQKICGRC